MPLGVKAESTYSSIADLGVSTYQLGLGTSIDGVESWVQYSSAMAPNKATAFSQTIASGVDSSCSISERTVFTAASANMIFTQGTSYQFVLPFTVIISGGAYSFYPSQNLYAPSCTVRAYQAAEIYDDYAAVVTDSVDNNILTLTVSIPPLSTDYFKLEIIMESMATGCFINSDKMLSDLIFDNVELTYYRQRDLYHVMQYTVLSDEQQAEIFPSTDGDTGDDSSGSDLSETNGLIGQIKEGILNVVDTLTSLPGKIWDSISTGLHELFIPSEEALTTFKEDMLGLFAEHFGALYDCVDIIEDYVSQMNVTSVTETITFPEITLDLGVPFTLGGWEVQVVPDGFDALFEALKWVIDAICTLAFINTMRARFDDLMVGGEQNVD